MQDQHQKQNVMSSPPPNMQTQNVDIENPPPEHQIGDDNWLSKKFNSVPFLLYKLWLILNFAVALKGEYTLITVWEHVRWEKFGLDSMLYVSTFTSFLLLFYGCGEMLFALIRRKSRVAQRSFLKFQYYFVGSIMMFAVLMRSIIWKARQVGFGMTELLLCIGLGFVPIIHLFGGYAVLRAFKKNHPFRKAANSEASDPLGTTFLEQNEALVSEVSRHDQNLNRWPYVVYNWWLKLTVAFEILVIFGGIFSLIMTKSLDKMLSLTGLLLIGALVLSLFNAYARFAMEMAMRTRNLTRSKRAVILLKISVVSSILSYLLVAIEIHAQALAEVEIFIPSFKSLAFFAAIPVLCLFGAFKVHKLIEERDPFAKFSSYNEDKYL